MCSNFGMNHHPGRPPAALENSLFLAISRWVTRLREAFHRLINQQAR